MNENKPLLPAVVSPPAVELEVCTPSPIADWAEAMLGRGPKVIVIGGPRIGKTQALREAMAKNVTPKRLA